MLLTVFHVYAVLSVARASSTKHFELSMKTHNAFLYTTISHSVLQHQPTISRFFNITRKNQHCISPAFQNSRLSPYIYHTSSGFWSNQWTISTTAAVSPFSAYITSIVFGVSMLTLLSGTNITATWSCPWTKSGKKEMVACVLY